VVTQFFFVRHFCNHSVLPLIGLTKDCTRSADLFRQAVVDLSPPSIVRARLPSTGAERRRCGCRFHSSTPTDESANYTADSISLAARLALPECACPPPLRDRDRKRWGRVLRCAAPAGLQKVAHRQTSSRCVRRRSVSVWYRNSRALIDTTTDASGYSRRQVVALASLSVRRPTLHSRPTRLSVQAVASVFDETA